MKKKLFVALVLALCLLLSGCTDGAITAREARNGVARVLVIPTFHYYSPTEEYLRARSQMALAWAAPLAWATRARRRTSLSPTATSSSDPGD